MTAPSAQVKPVLVRQKQMVPPSTPVRKIQVVQANCPVECRCGAVGFCLKALKGAEKSKDMFLV